MSLLPGKSLVGDVIVFYLKDITTGHENIHVFSEFDWEKVVSKDKGTVAGLVDKHLLLMPVHLPGHWALITVDVDARQVSYYDSLLHGEDYAMEKLEVMKAYLEEQV